MKNLTLNNIASACNGTLYASGKPSSNEILGVTIDSRKIQPGFLFIPIKGARVDGHDFIPQVMKAGAYACLSEHMLEDAAFPYIHVASTEQALKDIAAFYLSQLPAKVIGITGSVGKTSTKEMIASILSEKYQVLKTEGNFNNEIGLPLTIFRLSETDQIAILEMGISDFGEMHRLAGIARPDLCVITNIGPCHLENLGSLQGVLKAKSEIFDYLDADGKVFLNGDDPNLKTVTHIKEIRPAFFGLDKDLDVFADNVKYHGLDGTTCTLHIGPRTIEANIPIPGEHMVYNALAGAAIGACLDLSDTQIQDGIAKLKPIGGRNNLIKTDYFTILDDCYNANPISMNASLDVLSQAAGRKAAILGDMFELGEETAKHHSMVGRHAAKLGIDLLICIGTLAENISEAAKPALAEVKYYPTKEAFIAEYKSLFHSGDTILVKASHGMAFDQIVELLKNWSA